MVKGEAYYYFQYSDPGGIKRQLYIGRKDSSLDKVVKSYQGAKAVLRRMQPEFSASVPC